MIIPYLLNLINKEWGSANKICNEQALRAMCSFYCVDVLITIGQLVKPLVYHININILYIKVLAILQA